MSIFDKAFYNSKTKLVTTLLQTTYAQKQVFLNFENAQQWTLNVHA
jgi:hypothetical protein